MRSVGAPAIAERHKGYEWHKGRCIVCANLKAGKTIKALANLTTTFTSQNPFAPWGVSPQAKRLLSLLFSSLFINQFQFFVAETSRFNFILLPLYDCVRARAYDVYTHTRTTFKKQTEKEFFKPKNGYDTIYRTYIA
ncbi:MAG: hypothetical protein IIW45_02400 [Alistipes sp.]|nr:hypothetical protein [Alistipes sp.]